MKRVFSIAVSLAITSSVFGQSFTFTTSAPNNSGVTSSGISNNPSTPGQTLTGNAVYTLQPASSGFNRYDVRVVQSRAIGVFSILSEILPSASTSVNGTTLISSGSGATASLTSTFASQSGATFTLGASATRGDGGGQSAQASTLIAAVQAPLASGSVTTGSVPTAGSPLFMGSTSNNWIFDFPGDPATGTATINLSSASANFARALDGLSLASLHRDNLRLDVAVFLNGVQVGATSSSAVNTTLAAGVGATSSSFVFNTVPSVTLNPADIYGQTKNLTVQTRLVGTAFFGNSTSLGDYTIASSTFSGVTVQGVPEPASIAGLSLGLLAFARRRKNK